MKLITSFLFACLSMSVSAQTIGANVDKNTLSQKNILPDTISVSNVTDYSHRWNILFENQDILMSFKFEDCHIKESGMHKEKAFLKFENKTVKDIEFSYYVVTWQGENCTNCIPDNNNFIKTLRIPANSLVEGFCGIDGPRKLEVFSKNLDFPNSRLTDFKLTNLDLIKINH
jgi:hypothetical protein